MWNISLLFNSSKAQLRIPSRPKCMHLKFSHQSTNHSTGPHSQKIMAKKGEQKIVAYISDVINYVDLVLTSYFS